MAEPLESFLNNVPEPSEVRRRIGENLKEPTPPPRAEAGGGKARAEHLPQPKRDASEHRIGGEQEGPADGQ